MGAHAHQVYRKTQVSTASAGDLLIMLFDGAIKFAGQAKEFILQKKYESAHEKLVRCQDIMSELNASLNHDAGEIAGNLSQLYMFIHDQFTEANIKKEPQSIDNAVQMLMELRETWKQVVQKKI